MGPRADLAKWPEGFKLEGPMDSTTTYAVIRSNNIFRINFQTMVTSKRWFLLQNLTNILQECHIKRIAPIGHFLKEAMCHPLISLLGRICILMAMLSIQIEEQPTHKSTAPKKSTPLNNGPWMIQDWLLQTENSPQNTGPIISTLMPMTLMQKIIAGAVESHMFIDWLKDMSIDCDLIW